MTLVSAAPMDLKNNLGSLKLDEASLVLCPITDTTHWGLLAFVREDNTFFHFDSLNDQTVRIAERLAKKLYSFLVASDQCSTPYGFIRQATPQQINTYDCGLYVLYICSVLCQQYVDHLQVTTLRGKGVAQASAPANGSDSDSKMQGTSTSNQSDAADEKHEDSALRESAADASSKHPNPTGRDLDEKTSLQQQQQAAGFGIAAISSDLKREIDDLITPQSIARFRKELWELARTSSQSDGPLS